MTQKERIEILEKRVEDLEARLAVEESRGYSIQYVYPYWSVQPPYQPPSYPTYPWQTTWAGDTTTGNSI